MSPYPILIVSSIQTKQVLVFESTCYVSVEEPVKNERKQRKTAARKATVRVEKVAKARGKQGGTL